MFKVGDKIRLDQTHDSNIDYWYMHFKGMDINAVYEVAKVTPTSCVYVKGWTASLSTHRITKVNSIELPDELFTL